MDIGKRIRDIRKSNGQKLLEIASATGLSQPFISEVERNIKVPSIEALERICSALGISLSDFFAEDKPELAPDIRRLIQAAERLTPEQRELVWKLLENMTCK